MLKSNCIIQQSKSRAQPYSSRQNTLKIKDYAECAMKVKRLKYIPQINSI